MTPEFKDFLKETIKETIKETLGANIEKSSNEEIFKVQDAADFLGLSKSHVYRLTSEGRLPYYKPSGKIIYFKKSDLILFKTSKHLGVNVSLDGNIVASHVNKITETLRK